MTVERFPHGDGDVSVVIVTYRSDEALSECLASFERFRPARVGEVVVVDNEEERSGPTPAARFPWIDYDPVGENVHFRRGVNRGARRARLPYLFVLNPDTRLNDAGSIALLAETLDADPRVGFVGPRVAGEDGRPAPQGERLAGLLELLANMSYLDAVWPGNPIRRRRMPSNEARLRSGPAATVSAGAVLCRREQFLAVGGFDERAPIYWEEHELARKLARLDLRGWYRADASIFHAWRRGGTEHETLADSIRNFDEALQLYYTEYVPGGRSLYRVLQGWQRLVRALRHRVPAAASQVAGTPRRK